MTHVIASGPKGAPPLVLLHGQLGAQTMWSPNVADVTKDYWVYTIDVMGQPSKSIPDPDEPIQDVLQSISDFSSRVLDFLNDN